MKRILATISAAFMFIAVNPAVGALAAEDGAKPPSNVTITVVMPESTADTEPESVPETTPDPIAMYPVDVTETDHGRFRQIVKTYELNENEKPDDIPRADFERAGWSYTLTDILRKETANMQTREYTETVTLNTDDKEIEKILPLLPQTMEFKSADGFIGILELEVSSIKVETAGTRTSSYTMNITREYPHLSTNDSSFVPKTVTERGKTYTLVGVEWKPIRVEVIDYEDVPTRYTAVATYSATGSSTVVTGYVTTAEYRGVLSKLVQGRPIYAAYFIGEEIRTPLEMTKPPKQTQAGQATPTEQPLPTEQPSAETAATPEPSESPPPTGEPIEPPDDGEARSMNALFIAMPILGAAAGAVFYFIKKKKGASKS